MTDLKPEDLVKLREIAEKATPGPWSHDKADDPSASFEVFGHDGSDFENFVADCRTGRDDAEFIATFDPPTVLSLIADRARMEKALRKTTDTLLNAAAALEQLQESSENGAESIKTIGSADPSITVHMFALLADSARRAAKYAREGASQ